jgi:hypothetical protein
VEWNYVPNELLTEQNERKLGGQEIEKAAAWIS